MVKFIIILSFLFFLSPFLYANEYCEIDDSKFSWSAWEQCDGRIVKIVGNKSKMYLQHPTGLHDFFDLKTGQFKKKFEHYINFAGHEIIVTFEEKIVCEDSVEIEGVVDIVDLGGDAGTKGGYKNVWIKASNMICKE